MTTGGRHKTRMRLADARDAFLDGLAPVGTEQCSVTDAGGRVLASHVDAAQSVPHYRRAAMDGFAVQAADTFGASDRSPAMLELTTGELNSGQACRVHTGSAVPESADAVVRVEATERRDDRLAVHNAVGVGTNVAPIGEDVMAGDRLYEAGKRLTPPDLGLLRTTGKTAVSVHTRPTVGIVPTGDELVATNPAPGEVVESNSLVVADYCRAWNGDPTRHEPVPDERDRLREALTEVASVSDLLVTIGGSSVGERDLVGEIVEDLGAVTFHGVSIKPGHPVAGGHVAETPTLVLPGYPVSCVVNAVQLLRPALYTLAGTTVPPHPTRSATLTRKVRSEPGVRTFTRVTLDGKAATPIEAAGASVMSSVTAADGWVVVEESKEGVPAGESVAVEQWDS